VPITRDQAVVAQLLVDTANWTLEPQADGTLHGLAMATVITNGCGKQGRCTGRRSLQQVPQAVVLLGPTLFQS
jgi:hypothetical protein